MSIDIATMIMGVGLVHCLFRFYSKYDDNKDKREVLSTTFLLIFMLNLVGVSLIFWLSSPLASVLFDSTNYEFHFKIMGVTMLFQSSITIPLMYFQAKEKPHVFVLINFIKLLMQLSLNIYFLVFLNLKVLGVLYSTLISGIVISLYLIPTLIKNAGLKFSMEKAKSMIKFGIPMVFTGVASFYMNFSDRYFLKFYSDLTEVGLYSLSYKFGFLLMILVNIPFSNTWNVQRFNVVKMENARETFQKTFVLMSFLLIIAAFLLSIGSRDLIRIMASPDFETAAKAVPIILFAFIFQGWTNYVAFGIYYSEKTIHIAVATFMAAMTVTIFCFLLIPSHGSMGAAYATLIAFIVRFFWVKHKANKFYNMDLKWGKPLGLLSLAVLLTGLSTLIQAKNIYVAIGVNIGLSVIFIASIFLLPFVSTENKKQLLNIFKNPISGIAKLRRDLEMI